MFSSHIKSEKAVNHNSLQNSALAFGVWHDIKTCDLREVVRGRRDEANKRGGWSLEQTCVWELSVIHTLLIPIQLCAIQSPGHFTERGALLGVVWVFVSESFKRPHVNQQLYFIFWLISGSSFIHSLTLFFVRLKTAYRKKTVSVKSAGMPKNRS